MRKRTFVFVLGLFFVVASTAIMLLVPAVIKGEMDWVQKGLIFTFGSLGYFAGGICFYVHKHDL